MLGRRDIAWVLHKKKYNSGGNWQLLTHVVQHLGPDVATVESSWCAPFMSIPLKGFSQLGLGSGHMILTSHMQTK